MRENRKALNAIIGVMIMVAITVAIAATVFVVVKNLENHDDYEVKYPSKWISDHNIYGLYDLHKNMYVLHIENVSDNLSLTYASNVSFSMSPTIGNESLLIYHAPSDASNLSVGDIVLFHDWENSSKLIYHRIVKVGSDEKGVFYRTKGDANDLMDDNKLYPDRVVGVVVGIFY